MGEDLEAVRRSYEAFNRGDLEAWLGWFSADATWQAAREDPDAALHSGLDEIRRYAEGWIEAYEGLRCPLEMEQAQVMTVLDGRIAGTHEYFDRAEALAVVGPAG
jgi:ketosteroid isomerase-like protein